MFHSAIVIGGGGGSGCKNCRSRSRAGAVPASSRGDKIDIGVSTGGRGWGSGAQEGVGEGIRSGREKGFIDFRARFFDIGARTGVLTLGAGTAALHMALDLENNHKFIRACWKR